MFIIITFVWFVIARDPDLIETEIAQLEHLIQLQNEKLHYLKELREMFTNQEQKIPEINQTIIQDITTQKPFKQQSVKQITNKERLFTNRMLKKYQFNVTQTIIDASLLQTFQYKSNSSDNSFTQMLYVITQNQFIQLYDLANQFITSTQLEFLPEFISVSNRADDPIIALANSNGSFALYKIENTRVPIEGEETQNKPKTKLVIQLTKEIEFQLQNSQISSMIYAMIKGNKYIIFGSKDGTLYSFNRNGTQIGQKTINGPILQIIKTYPNMLFLTNSGFGYINPINLELVEPQCDNLPFKIITLTVDLQQTNIVYALSESQEIFVFEIKQNDQCKMKLKLTGENQQLFQDPKLFSLRHYLIVFDQSSKVSLLYNTTDVLTEIEYEQPILMDYFKNTQANNITLQTIKGNGASHYLLTRELNNEYELVNYYEIVMPQKKDGDLFSNFRFPIIIVAIVLVLLYQFWFKGKGKDKSSGRKLKKSEEEEIEKLIGKVPAPRSPTRSEVKQVKFDENLKRVDRFKEQLDNLDQKTKLLNDRVGIQNMQGMQNNREKLASQALLQKNKYI